jgi:hypothetical protein
VAQSSSKKSASNKVTLDDDGLGMLVPVTLYKKHVLFTVDTGSDLTLLDAKYKNDLGLPVDSGVASTPFSELPLIVYQSPELTVGHQNLQPQYVGCIDLKFLQMVVGKSFDGVLGMDLLKRYVVTFNPDKEFFSLSSHVPKSVKKHAMAVPLIAVDPQEHLQLQAWINNSTPINFGVDSGDSGFLSLNQTDWNKIFPDEKGHVHETLTVGAEGQPQATKSARIQTIVIGTNVYTNVIAYLSTNPNISSRLGFGFLKQHVVTLDFSNRVLYLTPSRYFGEIEEKNMSGLSLIKSDSKIMVYAVDQNSPAFEAGIRAGQELISINGEKADLMPLKVIRQILRQKDGAQVGVEVRQEDQTKKIMLRLRKSI